MKHSHAHSAESRAGSTLTEVLIAMIVIGFGVTSVMTLFPVATLRAIKANQLTQSTILRYQAESAVGAMDLANYVLFVGEDERPGRANFNDDGDVPNEIDFLRIGPGPNGMLGDLDDDKLEHPGPNGVFETTGPSDDFYLFDMDEVFAQNSDDTKNILIDPLGYHRADVAPSPPDRFRWFGGDGQANLLRRVTGGHPGNNTNGTDPTILSDYELTEAQARLLVTLPDQYATLLDTPILADANYSTPYPPPAPPMTVTTPANIDLPTNIAGSPMDEIGTSIGNGASVQVTFIGSQGEGYVRTVLASSAGYRIDFEPNLPPEDPTNPSSPPVQIERAIIQQVNADFTWMISARAQPPEAVIMDVVVFFKRGYTAEDERVFSNVKIVDTDDTDNDFVKNRVWVEFPAGVKPQADTGSFMLDVENNRWYRILEMESPPPNRPNSSPAVPANPQRTIELLLSHEVLDERNFNRTDPNLEEIQVAFPRGVLEVFPIGSKRSEFNVNPNH